MEVVVLVCVVLLVVLLATVMLHRRQRQRQRRRQLPPGPPSWPIIGSLHLLLGGAPYRALTKLSQRYGPYLFMKLGSTPTVVVTCPEIAKLFLQTHDQAFASRPSFGSLNHLTYGTDHMLVSLPYGQAWRDMRRLYTVQLFTAKRVNDFMPIMMEEIDRIMKEIRGNAEAGVAFNLTKGIGELLENIICRIVVGKRLAQVHDMKGGYSLKEAMHEAATLFGIPLVGDTIPWLSFVDRKVKRRMHAWRASVDGLLDGLLDACQKEGATSSTNDGFIQVLLANNLPRNKVKSTIVELLAAGIDTASVTLDWAMAELLKNASVMKKMEQEVEQVMGYGSKKMVQEEDLSQLVYLKAIIKETFRLHAPAPLLFTHMSTKECEVGGYTLPQGTHVIFNAWAMGRDSQVWKQSQIFLPDRFLSTSMHVDVRGQNFELIPFGSGRRICPGMPIALKIIELMLANIIYYFHWSLPPPHKEVDMTEKFGAVLSRASPLLAFPTLRSF